MPGVIFWRIALACLSTVVNSAFCALPENNPVPGGVAVIDLGHEYASTPVVRFGSKEVMVTEENNTWFAIVGLQFSISPGKYLLTVQPQQNTQISRQFRVNPLPSSATQRMVILPRLLEDLDFSQSKPLASGESGIETQGLESSLNPDFSFHQIVASGSFIPYGLVVRGKDESEIVNHTFITYITKLEELVNSPAAAIVEGISLDDNSGIRVVLDHGKGIKSVFTYLNDTILKTGDTVEQGGLIGTAMHLSEINAGRVDWQLLLNGNSIDPLQIAPSS